MNYLRKMYENDILFLFGELLVKLSFVARTDGAIPEPVCKIL